jgi:hypothetical protein
MLRSVTSQMECAIPRNQARVLPNLQPEYLLEPVLFGFTLVSSDGVRKKRIRGYQLPCDSRIKFEQLFAHDRRTHVRLQAARVRQRGSAAIPSACEADRESPPTIARASER